MKQVIVQEEWRKVVNRINSNQLLQSTLEYASIDVINLSLVQREAGEADDASVK